MHSMIPQSLIVAVLVVSPIATTPAQAGKPLEQDQPIPRELALALLNFGPGRGGSTDIRVGAAPDDLPPELLPPGLQVLGSTTQFETAVIVLAAPEQPDSAISVYENRLIATGWTKPPTPPVRPMRGFVPADAFQGQYQPPAGVCREKEYVTYTGWYRRTGGSIVKVTYNRGSGYSPCSMRQQMQVSTYRSPFEEAPIPLLRAPFGAVATSGGGMSSSGNDGFSLSTQLSTKMKAADVVAHYDKQMRDQGWASLGEGALPFLAAHTYSKSDEQGRPWISMLFSVAFPDSSKQDITLRLVRSPQSGAK